ncbi:hypothetical protein Kfla_6177 [Kribbella flavida DSM 17836]|uniref:Uncharacterized protein n=1 Tax=Kribbella flavida (strain DSM 17836 / JCM 10339 / NBRC 14399) TaxID=479435 RepID=D2PUC9_KRIFD|nr:hypothetical protein [Kribbella flavida]ADB35180.1 hypothetical protein Kfla_6177 [Kribbella flavida DSM 17836]
MAEEAVTTLRAELDRFERAEVAFALLETFLEVAGPWLGSAVLDPEALVLPDEMTEDRAVVQGLIEEIEREPRSPARRLLAVTERAYDLAEPQARWDFTRLAYCSNLATVWSPGSRTTYFEVAHRARATYWLPDSLKEQYFATLSAKRWQIPEDWLAAVPKQPKPWWKRGRS